MVTGMSNGLKVHRKNLPLVFKANVCLSIVSRLRSTRLLNPESLVWSERDAVASTGGGL